MDGKISALIRSFSDNWRIGNNAQKFNRRPDSFESLDARAALPQNCSPIKLNPLRIRGNSTSVPELAHQRAMLLTDLSVLGINGARGLGAHLALTVLDLRTTPTGVTYDRSDLRAIPAIGLGAIKGCVGGTHQIFGNQ